MQVLTTHRGGLDAIAAALLEHETIDGAMVSRLVDEANGAPVHASGPKAVVPSLDGSTIGEGTTPPIVLDEPASPSWAPPAWPSNGIDPTPA